MKLLKAAIFLLIATCWTEAQTSAPKADAQDGASDASTTIKSANSIAGVPTFYSHARQVLIETKVWNHIDKTGGDDLSWLPQLSALALPDYGQQGVKTLKGLHLPPPSRGLTANNFHILDNGVEQHPDYFKETDFSAVWGLTTQWRFHPTTNGIWGFPILPMFGIAYGESATYLIGYVPPVLQPGECRSIQVVAPNHYVQTTRKQYCAAKDSKTAATADETLAEARMLKFANSTAPGKIKVAVGALAFWSSGVLNLAQQTPAIGDAASLPATDFTFFVKVHDSKASASVQIGTQFLLPNQMWKSPCPKDAAIYILGTVYKTSGEHAAQFRDTFRCDMWNTPISERISKVQGTRYAIPSVFDTETELRPGEYKVRVLVTDGKDFGRAYASLRVAPLNASGLTVSDVALDSILRDASLILRDAAQITPDPLLPTPLVSKIVTPGPVPEAPPLVQNVQFLPFPYAQLGRGDPLPVYFEIYKPVAEAVDAAVYYRMRTTNLKTGVVAMNTEPTSAADFAAPGRSVVPIGLRLDTNEFVPGPYRLEIQASDSAGRKSPWQAAYFNIQ